MTKITIYGTSFAKFRQSKPDWGFTTYCENVNSYFPQYIINWNGVNCSSIERIYANIKKDKNSDLIIIFHGSPRYIYCPGLLKDISIDDMKDISSRGKDSKGVLKSHITQTGKDSDFIIAISYFYNSIFYNPDIRLDLYISILSRLDNLLKNRKVLHITNSSIPISLKSGKTIPTSFKEIGHPKYYISKEKHKKLGKILIDEIISII